MSGNNQPGRDSLLNPMTFVQGLDNIQLDIVGFLAILGEGCVLANAQVSALSKWVFLPRLLPAPQALLRTNRPDRLEGASNRTVIGATSGNVRNHLNHVAQILHSRKVANGDSLEAYAVKVVQLTEDESHPKPIKAHKFSPLTFLNLLGALESAILIVFACMQGDGFALLATCMLSLLSTLIGIGSYWEARLPQRTANRVIAPSDIIIKYPHGAFLIVKDCTEELARKLYFAPEICDYLVGVQAYRAIALLGTVALMGGVIFLANANTYLQLAFAIAYIILNAAYWIVAGLPQHWNWDLSTFQVSPVMLSRGPSGAPYECISNDSFTWALWHTIAVTQSSRWARTSGVAPDTPVWNEWLEIAERKAKEGSGIVSHYGSGSDKMDYLILPEWDPAAALTSLLKNSQTNGTTA